MNPKLEALAIAIFLAALATPVTVQALRDEPPGAVMNENRFRTPPPEAPRSLDDWVALPARCDGWFSDTFGLRDQLVRWHNAVKLLAFEVGPKDLLVVGRHGWLFHGNRDIDETGRGLRPLTPPQLEEWRRAVTAQRDYFRARGIQYVFAVIPNKEHVYREHWRKGYNRVGPTRGEQVTEYLRAHADVPVLDLTPALIAAKEHDGDGDLVYFRLGSHFTPRGGFAATCALLDELRKTFPSIPTPERDDYELAPGDALPSDSLAVRLYLDDVIREEVHDFVPKGGRRARQIPKPSDEPDSVLIDERDSADLPRVVLVHDSFGKWIEPLLAEHCRRLVCMPNPWRAIDVITTERPDFVVQMYVENVFLQPRFPAWLPGPVADPRELARTGTARARYAVADLVAIDAPPRGTREFELPELELSRDSRVALRIETAAPARFAIGLRYVLGADARWPEKLFHRVLGAPGKSAVGVVLDEITVALPATTRVRLRVSIPADEGVELVSVEVVERPLDAP